MKQYKNIMAQLPGNAEDMGTYEGIQVSNILFYTITPAYIIEDFIKKADRKF